MRLILFLSLTLCCLMSGCKDKTKETEKSEMKTMTTTITERPYGEVDGKMVTEYTLTNTRGMQAGIITYGGIVTKIIVPDKAGNLGDVVLGYDSFEGYRQKGNPYFGALVGRFANRIAHAKFDVEGKSYILAANDHDNTLHGGIKGFDKVLWDAKKDTADNSITLSYLSPDDEEGFPGNLSLQVKYTLTNENVLQIKYTAHTDKATPINLTNHSYFNLTAGRDSTILAHILSINAGKFTEVNDQLLPTGKLPDVKDGPMDFRNSKVIGKEISQVKGGYDHNWVLDNKSGLGQAATLEDPVSGRKMEVWTTEPGIQFYSGNFLNGTLSFTKKGQKYVKHAGLSLETQHFPDSPNQPGFPNTILKPGEEYSQLTEYRFMVTQ